MASTSFAMTIMSSTFQKSELVSLSCNKKQTHFHQSATNFNAFKQQNIWLSLSCHFPMRRHQEVLKPIAAVDSGLEVSISNPEDLISVKDAKIVIESQDKNKIQIRVDLTSDTTQKVFDKVLVNLARSAPPIPGFRREKGGKTTRVPKDFLLQILGEDRVTKFVVQEIVSSTMTDYAKKANLKVKEKKVTTTQSAKELKKLFTPGYEFGFNVIMELEDPEAEE